VKELNLSSVPCKIININESDEQKVKEYVIKDNLLRRHLSTEQKYILIATLSEIYETPRIGMEYNKISDATSAHEKERNDVLIKTTLFFLIFYLWLFE